MVSIIKLLVLLAFIVTLQVMSVLVLNRCGSEAGETSTIVVSEGQAGQKVK